jgi:hypothetical protein
MLWYGLAIRGLDRAELLKPDTDYPKKSAQALHASSRPDSCLTAAPDASSIHTLFASLDLSSIRMPGLLAP